MRPENLRMGWHRSMINSLVGLSCLVSIAHSLQFAIPGIRTAIHAPRTGVWKLKVVQTKVSRASRVHHASNAKSSKEEDFSENQGKIISDEPWRSQVPNNG